MTVFMASGGGLLSFQTGFAIWVLISMLIFLWIMGKYAVPHISSALEEREKSIKDSLEAAEKAVAKAEEISKENRQALREAEKEAQKIRKDAVEQAEKLRAERVDEARKEADRLLDDARRSIEQDKQRAMLELRNEVSDLVIEATSRLIEAEMDQDKHRKLINSYLDNLVVKED
ncbi:MAG: F0F1 ATP synthase subunit B [Balneolaceae bacterium]